MATTPHTGITLLEQAQAQKEVTMNEALQRIDVLLNMGVVDRDLATPPGSPAAGDVYLVAASPTGAWSGKAGQLAYFDQIWRFLAPQEGLTVWINDENIHLVYNGTTWQSTGGGGSAGSQPHVCFGRLTAVSGDPVPVSDVTGTTTLYYTPYNGNSIALYSSGAWSALNFSEISFTVPATTNTNYDVFAYNAAGNVALETLAWTNATTRATALALQDGVYVKSGAATRRYLGSFRTGPTSGQTIDSQAKRFVWNYYHRQPRALVRYDTTVSWNYSTAAWRQANNSSLNQVEFLQGLSIEPVRVGITTLVGNSTATSRVVAVGLGLDTVSTHRIQFGQIYTATNTQTPTMQYQEMVSAGYHYCTWLEYGANIDTQTWYGQGCWGLTGQMAG